MSDTWVLSFTHLTDRPRAAQALQLLQRVASLVKPIMRKHDWRLPILSEFFPDEAALLGLNVNGGEKILIRLRPARSPDSFYDEEHLIGTMLHELTHNVHGPHDSAFYKYLNDLEDEYNQVRLSGWAGEGFHTVGQRLGANHSHNISPHQARQQAIMAAEKRRHVGTLVSGSRKLGGGGPSHGISPRELAARAAERRIRDDTACGQTRDTRTAQAEAERAEKDGQMTQNPIIDLTDDEIAFIFDPHANAIHTEPVPTSQEDIIDLTENDEPTQVVIDSAVRHRSNTPSGRDRRVRSTGWTCSRCTLINNVSDMVCAGCGSLHPKRAAAEDWTCLQCTLVNPRSTTTCMACDAPDASRTPDRQPDTGWICLSCGTDANPHQFWSCRACGTIKKSS